MAKKTRKFVAALMALSICLSVIPMHAFAAEETDTQFSTETSPEGLTTNVETTTKTTTDENGNVNVTVTVEKTTSGVTADGVAVERTETRTESNGNWVEEGKETTKANGTDVNISVDVPVTEGGSNTVTNPIPDPVVSGDIKKGEDDPEYDQTTTTIEKPASVTVNNTKVEFEDVILEGTSKLEHIASEVTPNNDNDLLRDKTSNTGAVIPENPEDAPAPAEGFEYVHLGTGNSSQFWVAFLPTTPANANDKPIYTYVDEDGNTVNLYAGSKKQTVDELYIEGEKVELDGNVKVNRSGVFQFVMYNPATGEVSTTYCADLVTGAELGYSYNIENLEDATYYSDAEAAMIRTVANNGYWGTKDDPATPEAEFGSLEAVKEMMRNAKDENGDPVFTAADIDNLTDGAALSATQFAIWTFSNKNNGYKIINNMYSNKNEDQILKNYWNSVPESEQATQDVLFKLYEYLINLDPSGIPEAEKSTANTIINEKNFLKDMNVTVLEKAENHENNADDDDTNDAYKTNLSFALVVAPSSENGDDLVVKVIGADGSVIASGRVAGEAQDGELVLKPDENGNYTFTNIVLTEGNQNFNLTLEGIQNLEEGVYLYSSEVRNGNSSQTMVGMAKGEHEVNVSMTLSFDLNVEDEVVVKERIWRDDSAIEENTPDEEERTPPTNYRVTIEGDGLEEIPDESVPLASAPKTGDISCLWAAVITAASLTLMAINFSGKKNEEE